VGDGRCSNAGVETAPGAALRGRPFLWQDRHDQEDPTLLQEREALTLVFENARVDVAGATDVGKARQKNEDQYLIAGLRRVVEIEATSIPIEDRRGFTRGASALLLLVADGVGGGKGGEEASRWTIDTIARYVAGSSLLFSNLDKEAQRALLQDLTLSVQWSHAAVRNQAAGRTSLEGMATTLTMVLVLWPRAYVVQIGDSRCYHLRAPTLTQVTRDQTIAQEMVDRGVIPPDAAERSPLSHVLSHAVGNKESDIWPAISSLDLEVGDTLLLCTDGLTKHVADAQIAELMVKAQSAKEVCSSLIDAALRDGGSDNVTVVVTRLLG
jgi:serine/threonine protein phosphatase PrpC